MKKHIITIEYEPSTRRGGQERSYFDILIRLQKKGHSVTLAYVVTGNLIEEYNKAGVQTLQIPAINLFNKLSIKEIIAFIRSFVKIKGVRNSVIYINQIQDLPLAALLKRVKGARKLVCHLRLPPLYGHLRETTNQISLFSKHVDAFIVANDNMKEAHIQNGVPPEKLHIIPNGFDFKKKHQQKPIQAGKLDLVYIGRLEDGKGLKELIAAMPLILNQFSFATLTVAGEPMNENHKIYLEECKKLTEALNIKNIVHFAGHQPYPIEFLKNFDITIFPSTCNESFGRVIVESIMAGVPVIARNIGATAEILNDKNKSWVFNNDIELIQIIESIISNPESYPLFGILEYQKISYSIDSVVDTINEVLIF